MLTNSKEVNQNMVPILPIAVGIGFILQGLDILFGDDDSRPIDAEEESRRLSTEQQR
jgi:hypothetical protein